MASRIRNRQPPPKDDADEERSIWVSLRAEGNRVDSMVVRFRNLFVIQRCLSRRLPPLSHAAIDLTIDHANRLHFRLSAISNGIGRSKSRIS